MMSKIILPLIVLLGMLACQKDPATDLDQIVFGWNGSECVGDCSVNYLLTSDKLFADSCDICFGKNVIYQTAPLTVDKFQIAEPLLASVPASLLRKSDTAYGCPGCFDGATYFVEITKNGQKHLYSWGDDFDKVPDKFQAYFEQVIKTIRSL